VECGAFDGEFGSNTLFMERKLQWKGILIEPDRKSFDKLLSKQRRSWALPVCLSTEPYPTKVNNYLACERKCLNKISNCYRSPLNQTTRQEKYLDMEMMSRKRNQSKELEEMVSN
jgi:predicted ATP-dependent protease